MKIAHLAYSMDTRAGWGRLSHEVITRLSGLGYEPEILTERASEFPNEIPILGRSSRMFQNILEIRSLIKKADIIHAWEANPYAITACVANIGLRKKMIITATGAYSIRPLYNPKTSLLTKLAYRKASAILCISSYIKDEIDKVVQNVATEVVTLGVDSDAFSGSRKMPSEPFILSVGNITHRKGYHVAIPAFAEIANTFPKLKYLIAGSAQNDPTYHRICLDLVQKHGLEGRIIFTGSLNDDQLKELYLSAELFLLPSVNFDYHFEGFGLVFLEAACAGLPVIGTTGNGIADAILEGKNGLLVPQNDIHATAEAMRTILGNTELHQRFSQESVAWAKQNSWDRMIKRYADTYERILRA